MITSVVTIAIVLGLLAALVGFVIYLKRSPQVTLETMRVAADVSRDWAAVLAAPVLTAYAAWLTWIVVWGGWPLNTAELRLKFLGASMLLTLGLILYAIVYFQRRTVNVRAETPAGSVEVTDVTVNGQ